jgi:MYXO-CTERM domain-containing protein
VLPDQEVPYPLPTLTNPCAVAVSGSFAAVAATGVIPLRRVGSAWVFDRPGVAPEPLDVPSPSDQDTGNETRSVAIGSQLLLAGRYFYRDETDGTSVPYFRTSGPEVWRNFGQPADTLTPSDAGYVFGLATAMAGNRAALVARADLGFGSQRSAVYVFDQSNFGWTQEARIAQADDPTHYTSVALFGDTVAIGSTNAALVMTRDASGWSLQQELAPPDTLDQGDLSFAYNVALSGDTLVATHEFDDDSGTGAGAAYVYTRSGSRWTLVQKLHGTRAVANDRLGISGAIDGNTIVLGAVPYTSGDGYAVVYTRERGAFVERQTLFPKTTVSLGNFFGNSVAVSGAHVAVGSRVGGHFYSLGSLGVGGDGGPVEAGAIAPDSGTGPITGGGGGDAGNVHDASAIDGSSTSMGADSGRTGTTGSGGVTASGGAATSSGGSTAASGGSTGVGEANTGGTIGSGGVTASGGAATALHDAGVDGSSTSGSDNGNCSCRMASESGTPSRAFAGIVVGAAALSRRRRARRTTRRFAAS